MNNRLDLINERKSLRTRKSNLENSRKDLVKLRRRVDNRKEPDGIGIDATFEGLAGHDIDKLYGLCYDNYHAFHKNLSPSINQNIENIDSQITILSDRIKSLSQQINSLSMVV